MSSILITRRKFEKKEIGCHLVLPWAFCPGHYVWVAFCPGMSVFHLVHSSTVKPTSMAGVKVHSAITYSCQITVATRNFLQINENGNAFSIQYLCKQLRSSR